MQKLQNTVSRQRKFIEKVKKFLEMKYINSILPKELIERTDAYNIEIRGNNVVIEPHEGVAIEYLP